MKVDKYILPNIINPSYIDFLESRVKDLESVVTEDRKKIVELVEKYEPEKAWWNE